MLYAFLISLADSVSAFGVFRFITFRAALAVFFGMLVCLLFGPMLIRLLERKQIGEEIRIDGPQSHLSKKGTPTMGGLLILTAVTGSTLLWANLTYRFVWLILLGTLAMGVVGFIDDYLKLKRQSSKGLAPRYKFAWQILLGLGVGCYLYLAPVDGFTTRLSIPFVKWWVPDLGAAYILLVMLMIVGCSNAVNLTDGLDGLATGPMIMASGAYTVLAYMAGHAAIARYLQVIAVRESSEVTIFGGAVLGASLGFLWFNAYPAQIFMGDTGSLALGTALALLAVLTKHELLLVIIGGVFVIETVSVLLQVFSYKTTGRRIFRMAPIHHHYELNGLAEPKIFVRFWIISFLLALISLTTLKLR